MAQPVPPDIRKLANEIHKIFKKHKLKPNVCFDVLVLVMSEGIGGSYPREQHNKVLEQIVENLLENLELVEDQMAEEQRGKPN